MKSAIPRPVTKVRDVPDFAAIHARNEAKKMQVRATNKMLECGVVVVAMVMLIIIRMMMQ